MNHNTAPPRRAAPRVASIAALILSLGTMMMLNTEPASADPQHGLRNVATQRCLTSDIFQPGHHGIATEACSSGFPGQLWHHHRGNYAWRVMNYTSGICLDSNASGNVYGNRCTANNAYQEWRITSNSYGSQLRNVATGRCLDSNTSGDTYTRPCTANNNFQRWRTR
jgi:hypothetical protein